ncbi:hypothetical protein [Halomonas sp. C05BenzN]|uniref:hypothetical protein n=1 Tax=Halomonas sp. C05BenzN TaxID=3411041 RepID=UPI003B9634DD
MNLHRAYLSLCGFYSLLILIGIIALLAGGATLLALPQLVMGALGVVGLWGYFLKKGFMSPRMWRPFACLLGVAALAQLFLIFAASPSGVELTWLLTSAIFSLLLVVILYRYGDRDQALWASPEELEGGRVLGELLEAQHELTVEKQAEDRQATVRVQKAGNEYRASVVRQREAEVERFEERFTCPATLAFFIEKFTCISVRDFADKYTSEASPA